MAKKVLIISILNVCVCLICDYAYLLSSFSPKKFFQKFLL